MRLPGFEMIERLGEGGMATVWKARQISLDRMVAIKIMSSRLSSESSDVGMFLNEAQSTAKLKHPGIIQIYDANVKDGAYYYIMEYVAGYTVGDWVRRKNRIPEKDALTTVDCVADALNYAWERERIIHCDIKPDNIMIDSDGSVKVADLGLCKTISSLGGGAGLLDEVMGTACYMSPEQAQGRQDIDCRADIYSLGAMLYYLLSGKLLFEGSTDEKVMELQCSSTVPDVLDVNAEISKPASWLIEKMLMKDRNRRHTNWNEVISDIARVKKHHLPQGAPWPDGGSTMQRSKHRTIVDHRPISPHEPSKTPPWFGVACIVAILALGLAVYFLVTVSNREQPPQTKRKATAPMTIPVSTIPPEAMDRNAKEMFDFAKKWAVENPAKYDEIAARFRKVTSEVRGTKYSLMAEDEIRKTMNARNEAVVKIIAALEQETSPLIQKGKFIEAAAVYDSYTGPLAAESAEKRAATAVQLRKEQERAELAAQNLAKKKEEELSRFLDGVSREICTAGLAPARVVAAQALGNENLAGARDKINTVVDLIDSAMNIDAKVLASFKAQIGKETPVELVSGRKMVTVNEVGEGKVRATQKLTEEASISLTFSASDLSQRERLLRMGSDDSHDVALYKGTMAVSAKDKTLAKTYFQKTHPLLSARLIAYLDSTNSDKPGAVQSQPLPVERPATKPLPPELAAMKDNPEAVAGILLKQNPGLKTEHIVFSSDESGAVRHVTIAGNALKNAAPLAALSTLRSMYLGHHERLKDISTFKFLSLDKFEAPRTRIADLTPLKGMPLQILNLAETQVKDISPLKGMQLTHLDLSGTKVLEFQPLASMPLKQLRIRDTQARNLSCIKDLALDLLDIARTRVVDFSFLSELKELSYVDLSGTQFKNVELVKALPKLASLYLSDTPVADISALKGTKIKRLDIGNTGIKDFSVIRELPLTDIYMGSTKFKDMQLLAGKKLSGISLAGTDISDLGALRGMQLTFVDVTGLGSADLSVLAKMPIENLRCYGVGLEQLQRIAGVPLKNIWCDSNIRHLILMKMFPLLKTINGLEVR